MLQTIMLRACAEAIHPELTEIDARTVAMIEFIDDEYVVSGWSLVSGDMISEWFFPTLASAREFMRDSRDYIAFEYCGTHIARHHRRMTDHALPAWWSRFEDAPYI